MGVLEGSLYKVVQERGDCDATLRNRLLTVWRRAIRCAPDAAYQSDIDPILKENKIADLTNRWIVQYTVFVRRCYRMEAPPAACKKLQVTSHAYHSDSSLDLDIS